MIRRIANMQRFSLREFEEVKTKTFLWLAYLFHFHAGYGM